MGLRGPKPGTKYKLRVPQDLADARWVAEHPYDDPGSPMQAKLQELFRDDFEKFLRRKDKLEADYLAACGPKSKSGVSQETPDPRAEEDKNSLRIEELIDELLAKAMEDQ